MANASASKASHASEYIRALLSGSPPNGSPPEAFGAYRDIIGNLVLAYGDGSTPRVRQAWKEILQRRPDLAELVSGDPITSISLANVLTTFNRWLNLPDEGLIPVVLSTVVANRLAGDPVWLMLIGGSSYGKTEVLVSLAQLPHVYIRSVITESGLLSGTPARDKAAGARGGLLRELGTFGYLVLKDFTSVLSMHRDARATVLSALREIYDGRWSRNLGVDGGRTLTWEGKLVLLAGCTATIDTHHAVIGAMGERFVLYRLPRLNAQQANEQARRALETTGQEHIMRTELANAVAAMFAAVEAPQTPLLLQEYEQTRLIALATLAARCRSPVERESYPHDIQLIPDAEAPSRLARILVRLLTGMSSIGLARADAWQILVKLALDCMPDLQRKGGSSSPPDEPCCRADAARPRCPTECQ